LEDLQTIVNDIAKKYGSKDERGTVADYIPQLACVDPNQFGISIVT
jgi:glutaminase